MLNAAIGASVTLKPGNASAFLATQVVLATIQLAFGAIAVAEIPTASHSIHIMARKSYLFFSKQMTENSEMPRRTSLFVIWF